MFKTRDPQNMVDMRYMYFLGKQSEIKRSIIDEMHMERKRCLIDELNWGIDHQDGLESDQFDHSQTEYVIVQEGGIHAASLRLHKNTVSSSLMSAISKEDYECNDQVWELSRFISSNFSFSSSEYILITAAFYRLAEINVPFVYATLNISTARLFRMLGVEIQVENRFPCKLENCKNYMINTDLAAFERFYRRVPNRDLAILRTLSPVDVVKKTHARLGRYPMVLGRPKQAPLIHDDI